MAEKVARLWVAAAFVAPCAVMRLKLNLVAANQ
jgi:hypothetical protein